MFEFFIDVEPQKPKGQYIALPPQLVDPNHWVPQLYLKSHEKRKKYFDIGSPNWVVTPIEGEFAELYSCHVPIIMINIINLQR
jgi:hypothetical protein